MCICRCDQLINCLALYQTARCNFLNESEGFLLLPRHYRPILVDKFVNIVGIEKATVYNHPLSQLRFFHSPHNQTFIKA